MNKEELIDILNSSDDKVFKMADEIRKKYVGNDVHLRGLIEFTNICKCNCKYCGLRFENNNIERYRIEKDEIVSLAQNAVRMGYRTIVLQGGEDNYYNCDKMTEIIREIKKLDTALTLSIGEKTFDELKEFKKAGADRYLLRIETTDRKLYSSMHPNASFDNRLNCLYNLKKLGYETGTGVLVGLPNQTIDSLADDILFFKELNADMVGIGPFIAHGQTPLNDAANGDFWLALKVMALTRIMLPDINIPATTAMETLQKDGRIIALNSGANVVMPNVTSVNYRKNYEIYPNKICTGERPEQCFNCISAKIKSIGRTVATSYGFRNDNKR